MNKERLIKIANGSIAALILFFSIRYILQLVPEITAAGIAESLRKTPPIVMIAALGVTALNYLLVIGYDLLTAHQLRLRVPRWHISVVSLISFILNNNLGLGALAGGLVRFRFLSRLGLSPKTIGNYILLFAWIYWLGLITLAMLLYLFVSPEQKLVFPFWDTSIAAYYVGLGATALFVAFVILVLSKEYLALQDHKLMAPFATPTIAATQILISTADWTFLGLVIYTLLPESSLGFVPYLSVFVIAQVSAIISHVPQGAGAFDAILLFYLKPFYSVDQIVSTLLLFRIIYFLIPLAGGILLLLWYESHFYGGRFREIIKETFRTGKGPGEME
ncbi:MAG: hypothetical protein K9L28_05430 [Synergistales bacterium]|nr:hypothetical protein [Synergistales bacterium]